MSLLKLLSTCSGVAELSALRWAIATQYLVFVKQPPLKINFQSSLSQIQQSSIAPTLFALLKPSAVVSSFLLELDVVGRCDTLIFGVLTLSNILHEHLLVCICS